MDGLERRGWLSDSSQRNRPCCCEAGSELNNVHANWLTDLLNDGLTWPCPDWVS